MEAEQRLRVPERLLGAGPLMQVGDDRLECLNPHQANGQRMAKRFFSVGRSPVAARGTTSRSQSGS